MTTSLDGRVVLVTGAARGMGAEHVRGLVRAGARVLATDVRDDEGHALVAEVGPRARYVSLDVTDETAWAQAVSTAERTFGPLAHLVNNAGVLSVGSLETTTVGEWRRVLDINLTGAWLGMRAALPSIRRAGGGSIVNVSSIAGLVGYANLGAYGASKWALRGLTKSAAVELGPEGIRVNLIHPGPIRTPMIEGLGEAVAEGQPIARVGEPREVTALLLFLLGEATYSTGHEFVVDGGAVAGRSLAALHATTG